MNNLLPVLPDVHFVETNAQQVIDDVIGGYEKAGGVRLAEGDPRRLFLLSLAYIIIAQRQKIDASGKSNLLYYARGNFLDHIGASRYVKRLPASFARTSFRFQLSAPQLTPIGIPAGTRVTHDNFLYWRTTQPATIPAMQSFVDVPGEAMTAGAAANGLEAGQIAALVDPIPFVASVENLTVTEGGADREDDEAYRWRIYQAPAAFSVAGPADAYVFYALTANQAIVDVAATSPSPSVADIRPLLAGGVIPGPDILEQVDAVLSDKTVRPLADRVDVLAPDGVDYSIEFTYYIRRTDQASETQIRQRVDAAVADYVLWQKTRLGRDINPDELISRVHAAGAKRLVITSPVFQKLERHEVAQDVSISAVYGGVEDE